MNVVGIPIGGLKTVWPNVFAIAIDNTHISQAVSPGSRTYVALCPPPANSAVS